MTHMQQRATWNIRMSQRTRRPTLIFLQCDWKVKNLKHCATDVTSFHLPSDCCNWYINSLTTSFLICCVVLQRWHCHFNEINSQRCSIGSFSKHYSLCAKDTAEITCVVVHHICDANHIPLFLKFLRQVAHIHPGVVLSRWGEIGVQF